MDWNTLIAVALGGAISTFTSYMLLREQRKQEKEKWIREQLYEAHSNSLYYLSKRDPYVYKDNIEDPATKAEFEFEIAKQSVENKAMLNKWLLLLLKLEGMDSNLGLTIQEYLNVPISQSKIKEEKKNALIESISKKSINL